ncbi:MAG: ABC transporter substrate-binding protein [Propionibacteriaceae bacterium]|jgi:NitT/TauT family transport system substrate-binding protein|nr:ABC transporter substrate-binding protein [Propionibacteriaceae bacterium]
MTLAMMLAVTGCAGQPETVQAVVGLSYIPNIQFGPVYVADAQGWGGNESISIRHHGADEGLFTALAAGEEQFVIAAGDEGLQAAEQGIELVAVAPYYLEYPVRIIVPAESDITELADLQGKTIGLPGKYGESWFGLLVALDTAGLSQEDVEIQEIGYTAQAALPTGKVDAVVGFINNDFVQFQAAGVNVRALEVAPDSVPLVSATLFTTSEFYQKHKDVVETVKSFLQKGITESVENPEAAIEAAVDYIPSFNESAQQAARVTLDATLALMVDADGNVPTALDEGQWQEMGEFLQDVGVLREKSRVTFS